MVHLHIKLANGVVQNSNQVREARHEHETASTAVTTATDRYVGHDDDDTTSRHDSIGDAR